MRSYVVLPERDSHHIDLWIDNFARSFMFKFMKVMEVFDGFVSFRVKRMKNSLRSDILMTRDFLLLVGVV